MTSNSAVALLEGIPCFYGLGQEAMEWLLSSLKELSFSKGELIILEGEPCPGLFIVKSGAVRLYQSSPEGEEQIIRIIRRGGCFECVPLFDTGTNPVSAQALETTRLYLLSSSDFDQLLSKYPQAARVFIPILAGRLRSLVNVVGSFSLRQIYPRLARMLHQLSEREDEAVAVSRSLVLSQQHLACMLGCSRQAVNSALRKLVRNGIVRMEGHRITVLDRQALQRITSLNKQNQG